MAMLGMQWLQNFNPLVDWPNCVLALKNSSGQQFYLFNVRPHNIEPVVELCSAKVSCKEL